jgi:hypothetical protein
MRFEAGMNTEVEIDAERVRAVHAALAGPQIVWLLWWQNESDSGYGCVICASREKAMSEVRRIVNDDLESCHEKDDTDAIEEMNKCIAAVDKGDVGSFGDVRYWLQPREVEK